MRDGLADAFESGDAVTAKVTWLPHGCPEDGEITGGGAKTTGDYGIGDASHPTRKRGGPPNGEARTRYISCTPLLGSDDQVGVWMVVMVENELVTGSLASRQEALGRYNGEIPPTPSEYERENLSDEGGGTTGAFERSMSGTIREERRGKVGSEGGRLYADFMRNVEGGRKNSTGSRGGYVGDGEGGGVNGIANGKGRRVEEVRSP